MSYCRWSGDSDVYVYAHIKGGICCCSCMLSGDPRLGFQEDTHLSTHKEMVEHLERHQKAGHKVPERAIKRLCEEGGLTYPRRSEVEDGVETI